MGLSSTLYIGPYAICEVTPKTTVVQVRGCPATMCQKPKPTRLVHAVTSDFCSSCGCRIETLDITVEHYPSPYDAMTSERLSPVWRENNQTVVYFICNEGNQARKFILEIGYHGGFEEFHVRHEQRWFEQRYAAELELLKAYYGNCTLRWGVHYFAR